MNNSLMLDNHFVIRYVELEEKNIKAKKEKSISASSQLVPSNHKLKIRSGQSYTKELSEKDIKFKHNKIHQSNRNQTDTNHQEDLKEEKQYSRIPIEYMEEKVYGNCADKVRGRVVYRGYAPKNTYFYLKTIKELQYDCQIKIEKQYRGEDIYFNSKFQSGNLNAVVRISSKEYWLYMREDTNTHGLRQWFYFQIKVRRNSKIKLRVYKFTKQFSLYKQGMKPFIRTNHQQWKQLGQKVKYQYDSQQKCFYLEFQYEFTANKSTYFATLPPYTYTMLNDYLESFKKEEHVHIRKIGTSLAGFDINTINIISKKHKKNSGGQIVQKQAIIVLARTHPGETVSNFALEAFIQKVLTTDTLLENYNFYIIPMINPDGVFLGNHRTGVLGQDLNRNFHLLDLQYFPEIEVVEKYVIHIQKKQKVVFLFDLHGHSSKKNIFAYGEESQIGSEKYILSRIIPKLLGQQISSFKYDYCVFKSSKEKKNTARVYFSHKNNINSITFQQSYGLLDVGCIGIEHWKNFGRALASVLVQYSTFNKNIAYMKEYLQDQIQKDNQRNKQKIEKQKQYVLQKIKSQLIVTQNHQQSESAPEGMTKDKDMSLLRVNYAEEFKRFKLAQKKHKETESKVKEEQKQVKQQDENEPESDNNQLNSEQVLTQGNSNKNDTIQQQQSMNSQELSSGDEELQLKNVQLQAIKKDIVRVGGNRGEAYRRQIYSMAQKKVQLNEIFSSHLSPPIQVQENTQRLHVKHSSIVQRIFRLKSKQKQKISEGNYIGNIGVSIFSPNSQRGRTFQLPALFKK